MAVNQFSFGSLEALLKTDGPSPYTTLDQIAKELALVNNGGDWNKDFNEDQKKLWLAFAQRLVSGIMRADSPFY